METMILRTTLAATLTTVLLVSCSKSNEPDTKHPVDQGTIRAVATTRGSIEVETKSPVEGTSAKDLKVYVYAYNENFGKDVTTNQADIYAHGTMTFNEGTTKDDAVTFDAGFKGTNQLPVNNSLVRIRAVYPAAGWEFNIDNTSKNFTTLKFTGCEDVMSSAPRDTKRSGDGFPDFATLEMGHQLTRFDVSVKAENDVAQTAWSKIKSIVFKKNDGTVFKNSFYLIADSGTEGFAAVDNILEWPSYEITKPADKLIYADNKFAAADAASAVALTTTSAPICYTMMAPIEAVATSDELIMEITTLDKDGGADIVTEVKVDLDPTKLPVESGTSTKGIMFNVNLTFKIKEIKAVATIASWSTPVNIDKDVL